jgi:flavin-dependent dehydrogenase
MNGAQKELKVRKLLDESKERPEIKNLIRGGEVEEYSAHLITEGGIQVKPKVYGEGILVVGDAAGLGLNMQVTMRGMEYAMASGVIVGRVLKKAKEKNDFSTAYLVDYEALLRDCYFIEQIWKNLKIFRNARYIFFIRLQITPYNSPNSSAQVGRPHPFVGKKFFSSCLGSNLPSFHHIPSISNL